MPFSPKSLEEKPYNACLNCVHIGKKCDGPNFLAMTTERWSEWCRLRKEYLGMTSAQVAEQSGVAKVTVDRIFGGTVKDPRLTTMAAVTKVLVNGTWGQYPCVMAAEAETSVPAEKVYVDNPALAEKADNAIAQCRRLQTELETMRTEHKEEVAAVRSEAQRKIDFLKEQLASKDRLLTERHEFLRRKDRINLCLAILLGISVLAIIIALIIDATNPEVGFFWRTMEWLG